MSLGNVNSRVSRDGDCTFLDGVVKLAVTALAADLKPSIVLNEAKRFADFHAYAVAVALSLVKLD